jgi:hypothetical protein
MAATVLTVADRAGLLLGRAQTAQWNTQWNTAPLGNVSNDPLRYRDTFISLT